ncbi:hypothetical protein KCH_20580 [Kitasatospora cheerisanensis KCTC 2395]|uniref:Uncharacterized protein n=1 Tax=Kitasatospora cheerisanensis KCTC 2395 TaxID=1348663 RepID=A0A066Z7E6_9ACTN|nr:hypothetical protein KCH_20580 [Kitasatospora cheerisanensis KCTC 2395]
MNPEQEHHDRLGARTERAPGRAGPLREAGGEPVDLLGRAPGREAGHHHRGGLPGPGGGHHAGGGQPAAVRAAARRGVGRAGGDPGVDRRDAARRPGPLRGRRGPERHSPPFGHFGPGDGRGDGGVQGPYRGDLRDRRDGRHRPPDHQLPADLHAARPVTANTPNSPRAPWVWPRPGRGSLGWTRGRRHVRRARTAGRARGVPRPGGAGRGHLDEAQAVRRGAAATAEWAPESAGSRGVAGVGTVPDGPSRDRAHRGRGQLAALAARPALPLAVHPVRVRRPAAGRAGLVRAVADGVQQRPGAGGRAGGEPGVPRPVGGGGGLAAADGAGGADDLVTGGPEGDGLLGGPADAGLPFLDVTLRNTRAMETASQILGDSYARDLSAALHSTCDIPDNRTPATSPTSSDKPVR